jgi:protein-tyrosine phosphatase
MIDRIINLTECFPEEDHRYWHIHLPTASSFIDSPKTPKSIRRQTIQTLIDRTVHLIAHKPDNRNFAKVVTIISLPTLWDSQIVVFFDEAYYDNFFIRNDQYQQWTLI